MNLIIKINRFIDIDKLELANGYILSSRFFSYRFDESFCINKTKKVIEKVHPLNKKVYFLINKIFNDDELPKLKEFMDKLNKANIDGILFADFAVFMLAKELHMEDKCIFYHETFLRNSYDIKTYQELGISKIVCSKDMFIGDIANLDPAKKKTYGILAFGYVPIYESKRSVVSNFASLNKLPKSLVSSNGLELKENTRDTYNKIIEQEGIASIFNSDVLCYLDSMDKLTNNIDNFIIDSLFFDVDYINQVIDCFINHKSLEELIKINNSISFTDMFLNKKVGLE